MSYTWITPKTDWDISSKFTYTDYNRIRNNLLFINDEANELMPDKAQDLDLGDAKTGYTNDYYPSEFTAFEDALESFTRVGVDVNVGARNYYNGNNSFIMADALNRLEDCCLRWKDYIENAVYIPVESIYVSPTPVDINYGETKTFSVQVIPSDATKRNDWETPQVNPFLATKYSNTFLKLKDTQGVAGMYQTFTELTSSYTNIVINMPKRNRLDAEEGYAVTLDDTFVVYSNRISLHLPSTGSFVAISTNDIRYELFQLVGLDIDAVGVATLLTVGSDCNVEVYGEGVQDERNANWRTSFSTYINENYSNSLLNAMLTVSKYVNTSRNTVANYAAKFHLLAANEIGLTDSHMTVLGNKTYPYLINNYFETVYLRQAWAYGSVALRSLWDKGADYYLHDGIYWGFVQDAWNSNRLVYSEVPTIISTVHPLIFLNKTLHVMLEFNDGNYNYYSIDWLGESDLTLADVPLGSYVFDSRGARS